MTCIVGNPEFAGIVEQNQNITISDFTAYIIQHLFVEMSGYTNLDIQEREDRTVNVIDAGTNQTVTTADAQWVIVTYDDPNEFIFTGSRSSQLIVLSPNGNTGYLLIPSGEYPVGETRLPDQEQMIDSFELLSTATATAKLTTPTPAQEQSQQQRVQSAGGLTARINVNNFTTGDTITVNGTVAERGGYSYVTITVIDPRGEYVALDQPRVTADNIFTYSSVAGEPDEIMPEYQMVVSGNYLLQVQHGTDRVEFTFAYEATGNMTGETPTAAPSPAQVEPQQQPSMSPFSQQVQSQQQEGEQPQQQQNQENSVSIVPGSSSLTTDAYAPNPFQASVGETVTWTNDDSQPHTATSGENVTPDGRFDSGIMAPAATFEHIFTEAGEYPYFCLLHPNMVGTVSVS